MSHKTILFAIICCLLLSSVVLSFIEDRSMNTDKDKNWWALSFQNLNDDSLDFTIDNHSDSSDFMYEIREGNNLLMHESIIIPKGESKDIAVDRVITDTKTTVSVWTESQEKKEIYK